jgi:hypothetical protein
MLRKREWRKLLSEKLKVCYKLSETLRMLEQRMGRTVARMGETIEGETAREDQ